MLELRILTTDDAPAFIALRHLALQTDPDAFAGRRKTDSNSRLDIVQQRLAAATVDGGLFVVGAFDPNLVGVVGLVRPPFAHLQAWGLYVDPRCRRRGVGRALMARVLEIARAIPNSEQLELEVSERSTSAIRLYTSIGFRDPLVQPEPGIRRMVLRLA